jgi:hypothetical protein
VKPTLFSLSHIIETNAGHTIKRLMNPEKVIIVEPVEVPVPAREPAEAPLREPEREPEKVGAGA